MIRNKRVVNKMQVNNAGITWGQAPLHSSLFSPRETHQTSAQRMRQVRNHQGNKR